MDYMTQGWPLWAVIWDSTCRAKDPEYYKTDEGYRFREGRSDIEVFPVIAWDLSDGLHPVAPRDAGNVVDADSFAYYETRAEALKAAKEIAWGWGLEPGQIRVDMSWFPPVRPFGGEAGHGWLAPKDSNGPE